MSRTRIVIDVATGEQAFVAYTPEEEAAADAAEAAEAAEAAIDYSAIDVSTLNAALSAPGSVVRALALLVLQEINTLRNKAGLSTYTVQQLVSALQAKMR